MENNTILFQAVVIDNEDPMMLGRVRARFQNPPSDMGSYEDIIKAIKNPPWNEEKDKWQPRDPFVFWHMSKITAETCCMSGWNE